MFEEAAGINKYKQQRKSSLKKFDSVQKDLERVDDIIQEIENNVHSLELHLKRFKRHEKLSNELKEKDISLAYVKLHSLKSNIIPLEKLVNEAKDLSEKKSNQSSIFLKDLNDNKREYQIKLNEVKKSSRVYPFIQFNQDKKIYNTALEVEGLNKSFDELEIIKKFSINTKNENSTNKKNITQNNFTQAKSTLINPFIIEKK